MDAVIANESQINRSDYKILIVDDVHSNVLLLKILLTNEKFQVCTANCGKMCIEQARAEKPDLVLLDAGAGSGATFDWSLLDGVSRPYFLAGGLDPENAAAAVRMRSSLRGSRSSWAGSRDASRS